MATNKRKYRRFRNAQAREARIVAWRKWCAEWKSRFGPRHMLYRGNWEYLSEEPVIFFSRK